MARKITYDDTRDIAIRCVQNLIDLGYIESNDDTYFDIQDAIQDEINLELGLDIDDNFELTINK
jgi:hypothetical protein